MEINVMSILVDDQNQALEFYTKKLGFVKKKLGFVKKNEIPMDEATWLTVVGPNNPDGVELSFEFDSNPAVAKEVAGFKSALVRNGIPVTSFVCDAVNAEYERLKGLGVEFTQPPMDAGPVTIAVFDDTCGNLIQMHHING